jgi:hypothetical protein
VILGMDLILRIKHCSSVYITARDKFYSCVHIHVYSTDIDNKKSLYCHELLIFMHDIQVLSYLIKNEC